jgi:hypothetical protein
VPATSGQRAGKPVVQANEKDAPACPRLAGTTPVTILVAVIMGPTAMRAVDPAGRRLWRWLGIAFQRLIATLAVAPSAGAVTLA